MDEVDSRDESNPRSRRVNRAIFEYHQGVDRGETTDPNHWMERFPDCADELRRYLEDLAGVPGLTAPRASIDGLSPGDVLGDYVIVERLGQGSQGVVWKACPRQAPEIHVALKVMVGPARNDPVAVERFRDDARAIARMNHPHIIRTTYVGEENGRWFIVMERMEGGSIAERLADYAANPRAAAVLVEKVARAIHHAHTRADGVIHLDLKPANILLDRDGEPKVTDFGLAMRSEALSQVWHGVEEDCAARELAERPSEDVTATLTRAGIVGTLPYLSPEMAAGRWHEVSALSDVYGLGAVLYALLTGRPPVTASTTAEALARTIAGDVRSPRALNPRVDGELEAVCRKSLSRDPARRYGSADALANDLRRWLERRATSAGGRPSPLRELRFWAKRHPLWIAVAASLVVLLWFASQAVHLQELRRENVANSERIARQLDRELRMIRAFTRKLADNRELGAALRPSPAPDDLSRRRRATQAVLDDLDLQIWFELAGGNPLVNILVLDPAGVELADTLTDRPISQRPFHMRDYFRGVNAASLPRDHVHVARTFESIKDGRHKIAVSTRIWGDSDELLGVVVANFTIGPKLLGFDLGQETADAVVLCPRDLSVPATEKREDAATPWRYAVVLDRQYAVGEPSAPADVVAVELEEFQRQRELPHVSVGLHAGRLTDYHRVGETELVVRIRRDAPWPFAWWP